MRQPGKQRRITRRAAAWLPVAVCVSGAALAAGCSGGRPAPPHTVAVMRDGRGSADLDVGWAQARGRYDIEAPAGVSTISVTG
jgi:hypothetical protein